MFSILKLVVCSRESGERNIMNQKVDFIPKLLFSLQSPGSSHCVDYLLPSQCCGSNASILGPLREEAEGGTFLGP